MISGLGCAGQFFHADHGAAVRTRTINRRTTGAYGAVYNDVSVERQRDPPGIVRQVFLKWRVMVDEDGHYCFAMAL